MIRINLTTSYSKDSTFQNQEIPIATQNLEEIQKQGLLKIALMMVGVLILFVLEKFNNNELSNLLNSTQIELQKIQSVTALLPTKTQELETKTKAYDAQSAHLAQLEKWIVHRLTPVKVLDILQTELSDQIWFQNLSYEPEKGIIINGSALSDQGLSTYIEKLSKHEVFKEVNLGKITESTSEKGPIKKFELQCLFK